MDKVFSRLHLPLFRLRRPCVLGTIAFSFTSAFLTWAVRDYHDFLALGPGGLPYNIRGWLTATFYLRPFTLDGSEVMKAEETGNVGQRASREVTELPEREPPRPKVGGIVPHRQLSQHAPESMRKVRRLFPNAVYLRANHDSPCMAYSTTSSTRILIYSILRSLA